MSEQLTALSVFPPSIIAGILAFLTAAITNVTSNAATATLFLPIVGKLVRHVSAIPPVKEILYSCIET